MKAKELTVTKVKKSTRANGNASIPDTKEVFTSDSNGQVILEGLVAIKNGDFSVRLPDNWSGLNGKIANTLNQIFEQLGAFTTEVTRVAREVGTEGKLGGQAHVKGVSGTWKDLTDNVNKMANNLTTQVRNIAEVTTAVAQGDLNKKITVDVKGEVLELKNTINIMVDQLNAFSSEVTRVAKEVGTEGKLGGQAAVEGVSGTWKELTDNVNSMANNLTLQVRNIAEVTTAVAQGDLKKRITVDVKGEVLELKNTINIMVEQLGAFAAARDLAAQQQLVEREKELSRIEELERFRKLTVGRELKMIELKKEIEELQAKNSSSTK